MTMIDLANMLRLRMMANGNISAIMFNPGTPGLVTNQFGVIVDVSQHDGSASNDE